MTENFLRFTVESLSASYIPFPRFLMEDSLADLSNDAKVLYALMLDRASISKVNGFKAGICRMEREKRSCGERFYINEPGGLPCSAVLPVLRLPIFNFLDINNKSEPISDWIKVRIILIWWR